MNLNFGFEGLLEKGLIDLDFVHVCPVCLAYLPPDVWPMAKLVDLS